MRELILGALLSSWAWAQSPTNFAGSLDCDKSTFHQILEVSDRAPHILTLEQKTCHWSEPLTLEGVAGQEDVISFFSDHRIDRTREQGYHLILMANGDRIFLHYSEDSFALSGGTGKFPGIYGYGALTSKMTNAGKMTIRLEGQYTLPKF